MGENDYEAGYRGNQFHHGMDRAAYDAGKAKKEEIDAIGRMAGGGQPVEVPGVAFTLLLVAPLIWMVYPVLGVTIMVVPAIVAAVGLMFKIPVEWFALFAFILGVFSFFPGMKLEAMVSQSTVYRWVRGIMRIVFSAIGITALIAGKHARNFNDIPAEALLAGFFGSVIVYLTFQRLDLIYFPALKEIKNMQEKLAKGERPTRPLLKRMFFGFCWFIPVMVLLTLAVALVERMFMDDPSRRADFTKQYGWIFGSINVIIWYALCLVGKLPGTGKFMFNKRHEEDLKAI